MLTGQPFDIVKIRLQSRPEMKIGETIVNLIKNEGPLAFYKGTLSIIMGIAFFTSAQFGGTAYSKKFFSEYYQGTIASIPLYTMYVSGMVGGFLGSFFVVPVEHIRIKMQIQMNKVGKYSGSIDAFQQIFRQYGIRGVYTGYSVTLLRELVGYSYYYGTYELLNRLIKYKMSPENPFYRFLPLLFGAISGMCFWLSSYPIDTVKSIIQSQSIDKPQYSSALQCTQSIYAQGGIPRFWKGFTVCLVRSIPVNGFGYFSYEEAMRFIRKRVN